MTATIPVYDLGLRPYDEVLALQRALCRARVDGSWPHDTLLLVEHPPVVTLGRGTRPTSLPFPAEVLEARGLPVFEVERGGDVTLHAPGQLVGYPILDLGGWRRDLHWYLRSLEETLILGLETLGVGAGREAGKTGVWTGGRKIASIGIHVKQWVTMHGLALNVSTDLGLFDLIVPCGISGVTMTSVARETAEPDPARAWARSRAGLLQGFARVFAREPVARDAAELAGFAPAPDPAGGGVRRAE
jgi:lipoyl(octanoyl) transferase